MKFLRCTNCGEYIYKGKKFNARQETVLNEDYLGLRIYRFYIKCPRCMSEITFKTDPKNADYLMEEGGKRCFDAAKLAAKAKEKELEEIEQEEQANPMLALEKRTKDSRFEMEALEKLEELKEINKRQADVDYGLLLDTHNKEREEELIDLKREEELDEQLTKDTFKNKVLVTKDIGENYNFSNLFSKPENHSDKIKEKELSDSIEDFVVVRKRRNPTDPEINTISLLPGMTSYDSDE